MLRKYIILFIVMFSASVINTENANSASKIEAVVNETAITTRILEERMRLVTASTGIRPSEGTISRIRNQALQSLIVEALQMQDAESMGLKLDEEELKAAIADLEVKNNLKPGGFEGFAKANGIPYKSLVAQIETQLLWRKVLSRKVRPLINISDEEVSNSVNEVKSQKSTSEAELYEIVLPIDGNPSKVLEVAKDIIQQVRGGAKFGALARQFSQGPSASDGGEIGWVFVSQLRSPLKEEVEKARPNSILKPIETEDAVRIVKVGEKRFEDAPVNSEQVKALLLNQKLDLEARRYMRQLRRNAFIEIR